MSPFVLALVELAREEGSTASIEKIRNDAFKAILEGRGVIKTLSTSSLNGKSRTYTVNMAPDALLTQASQAIRLYNNGVITSTTFDNRFI